MAKKHKIVEGLKEAVRVSRKRKLHVLDVKKHGIGGVTFTKPSFRKQDQRFKSEEFFAVVFFPKVKGIGRAHVWKHGLVETLSHSKEAAIAKFDDVHPSVRDKRSWATSKAAGHMVRRIKVIDLGPA